MMATKLQRPPSYTVTVPCPDCGHRSVEHGPDRTGTEDAARAADARHQLDHVETVVECLSTPSTLWAAS